MSAEAPPEGTPRPESFFIGSIDNELSLIQGYVNAMNARIRFLETVAGEGAKDSLAVIKRGLKDAHRGLERLESRFSTVGDIKTDVWQTYRRVRELEEGLDRGEEPLVESLTRSRAGTIRTVTGGRKPSVPVSSDTPEWIPVAKIGSGTSGLEGETAVAGDENRRVLAAKAAEGPKDRTPEQEPGDEEHGAEGARPRAAPFALPRILHRVRESYRPPKTHEIPGEAKVEPEPDSKRGSGVVFPVVLPKSRKEVLQSIAAEERRGGVGINDPRTKRVGSAEGRIITQAVMTASSDPRVCLPHLAYVKIHEVRDLEAWLRQYRYVRRSKEITGTEKILHLLTLLQVGCRFESVAVLFSRTPKEVLSACNEVFEGLLEMHSETMLPSRSIARKYLYPHLWHVVHNSGILAKGNDMLVYSHWTKEDVYKVLITLNVYVGRYRSQGRFALEGDMLDWGRCIHVQHDADEYDVVHWIERLQATPPTRRKSKARFQLQALLPRR